MSDESVEQEKVGLQPAIVLMTSDEMKKKESGYYDSICDVRICIGKWINNSTVSMASNLLRNSFVLSLRDANSESVVRHSQHGAALMSWIAFCRLQYSPI